MLYLNREVVLFNPLSVKYKTKYTIRLPIQESSLMDMDPAYTKFLKLAKTTINVLTFGRLEETSDFATLSFKSNHELAKYLTSLNDNFIKDKNDSLLNLLDSISEILSELTNCVELGYLYQADTFTLERIIKLDGQPGWRCIKECTSTDKQYESINKVLMYRVPSIVLHNNCPLQKLISTMLSTNGYNTKGSNTRYTVIRYITIKDLIEVTTKCSSIYLHIESSHMGSKARVVDFQNYVKRLITHLMIVNKDQLAVTA